MRKTTATLLADTRASRSSAHAGDMQLASDHDASVAIRTAELAEEEATEGDAVAAHVKRAQDIEGSASRKCPSVFRQQ